MISENTKENKKKNQSRGFTHEQRPQTENKKIKQISLHGNSVYLVLNIEGFNYAGVLMTLEMHICGPKESTPQYCV